MEVIFRRWHLYGQNLRSLQVLLAPIPKYCVAKLFRKIDAMAQPTFSQKWKMNSLAVMKLNDTTPVWSVAAKCVSS